MPSDPHAEVSAASRVDKIHLFLTHLSLQPSKTFTTSNYWPGETRTSNKTVLGTAEVAFAEIVSFSLHQQIKRYWRKQKLFDTRSLYQTWKTRANIKL